MQLLIQSSCWAREAATVTTPILQLRKLRHRVGKWFAQDHVLVGGSSGIRMPLGAVRLALVSTPADFPSFKMSWPCHRLL